MSTRLSDYDYELPDEQIARYPTPDRLGSRLLVVDRATRTYEDRHFPDLLEYLRAGDCLVINQTRVIPARLFGSRASTGAKLQVFLHQRLETADERWRVLLRPARKAPVGEAIEFPGLRCTIIAELGEGEKVVEFDRTGLAFLEAIDRIGQIPLPPYLQRDPEESDKERYQTVFAEKPGAVAAPTAGLHFTPALLSEIEQRGVQIARVTLHTGLGTFRPVESDDITAHTMHAEYYSVDPETAEMINLTKARNGRVVAVGTTSVRTLETVAQEDGTVRAGEGMSQIFIYPPYRFRIPDAILTNFHMPKSTLLMMISAFADREWILECYEHAVKAGYRFFSYGDAMLIL